MTTLARILLLSLALLAGSAPGFAARADTGGGPPLPVEPLRPSLAGATGWLNSPPLTLEGLRGKVVLVDFWTYSCINCLRTLPYIRAWAHTYASQGLVVIGVHAPEFEFEHDPQRVRKALQILDADWPIAIDDGFAVWHSFRNQAWPALYFIDAQGRVRHHQFGEGRYAESEQAIRRLLAEAHADAGGLPPMASVDARGIGAAPDVDHVRSGETYLGYAHADEAAPRDVLPDRTQRHTPGMPRLNAWALGGGWVQRPEYVEATEADGAIVLRFHARDLHLVLGTADGRPVPFRITVDGRAPGPDHGVDVDEQGRGVVSGERLYQLVRAHDAVADRTFEIRFERAGARAWVFTFG